MRPQLLVVTEDDKYGDAKRQLCAQVHALRCVRLRLHACCARTVLVW